MRTFKFSKILHYQRQLQASSGSLSPTAYQCEGILALIINPKHVKNVTGHMATALEK